VLAAPWRGAVQMTREGGPHARTGVPSLDAYDLLFVQLRTRARRRRQGTDWHWAVVVARHRGARHDRGHKLSQVCSQRRSPCGALLRSVRSPPVA